MTLETIHSWYQPEPLLLFGKKATEVDQKIGLVLHGPYAIAEDKNLIESINIALVGTGQTISLAEVWIHKVNTGIQSHKESVLFPSFPGFERTFNCKLNIIDKVPIPNSLIEELSKTTNYTECLNAAIRIFVDPLHNLVERIPRPSAAVCALPQTMLQHTAKKGIYISSERALLTESSLQHCQTVT